MSLVRATQVKCPGCNTQREVELVQSLNTKQSPELKARLLEGKLNLLECECGRKAQLQSNLLFHDPEANVFCQVVPGGEDAMTQAAQQFASVETKGTCRLVPSLNALLEKVKLLDAGLKDWAIEITKVLLLAAKGDADVNRVVLFEAQQNDRLHWVLFDGNNAQLLASPLAPYQQGLEQWAHLAPQESELRIDRLWAVNAVRRIARA
jgi:hypothetical protein